jgi:hypothetical protein
MRSRRFLIDGTNATRGGGFTHLVNVVPEMARQAPADRFRVVVSEARVAESLPDAANVEVDLNPTGHPCTRSPAAPGPVPGPLPLAPSI